MSITNKRFFATSRRFSLKAMQHLDARPKDVLTAHGYTFASVNRIEDISSHRNVGTMNNCAYILKHFFNPTFGCQGFYANTYSHLRDENYMGAVVLPWRVGGGRFFISPCSGSGS